MFKNPVLQKFHDTVIHLFADEAEFLKFLDTPEHWWGSPDKLPHQCRTCRQWLMRSRRTDRLDYAIRLVQELKTTVAVID